MAGQLKKGDGQAVHTVRPQRANVGAYCEVYRRYRKIAEQSSFRSEE
jgi:hypothetical protein